MRQTKDPRVSTKMAPKAEWDRDPHTKKWHPIEVHNNQPVVPYVPKNPARARRLIQANAKINRGRGTAA
jgi:hypothetical protein